MVITVRDGQKVWPTCPECGCRLRKMSGYLWTHFLGDENVDARGCKCTLVNKLWELIGV